MARFRRVSREKLADPSLADKLHLSTATSLAKSSALIAESPDWQQRRRRARQIKLHTLTHLDRYLAQFIQAATAAGATVAWADTGALACDYVVRLAQQRGVRRVAKAKSMTGEEIEINPALEAAGIEPVETDFGEMICQLAGVPPSHVTAPIIQWSIEEVASLLVRRGIADPAILESLKSPRPRHDGRGAASETERVAQDESPRPWPGGSAAENAAAQDATSSQSDYRGDFHAASVARSEAGHADRHAARIAVAARLVASARRALREKFLSADMGVSGANFAVAESGTLVLVENEANIRLSTTLPRIHVAVVGIEKLIPRLADLGTFLSLLPVAATGQRQSGYVSLFHRPFRELHIVLLDNGRSRLLADPEHFDLLSCIRCGACMNVCPVYRHVSGHGYGSVYPGPIGAVLTPHLRGETRFRELPFASSLCGACTEACPVGIPLSQRLLQWRDRVVRAGGRPTAERVAFAVWAWLMRHPKAMRGVRPPASWLNALAGIAGPGRDWSAVRDLPSMASETFADWWKKNRASRQN